MENENIQPLDTLMTQWGLSNADLVNASTEQLSFKMVQKGRRGKRLTPNIQEKILKAIQAAKPEVKVRRRDLFRYDMDPDAVEAIRTALSTMASGKIKYPRFVDLLAEAGVTRYAVEVMTHRITYYGAGGEAYVEQGAPVSETSLGSFDETKIRSAITAAQKGTVDFAGFLKKIHEAGIAAYEVNVRNRTIHYKGETESYREDIPSADAKPEVPAAAEVKVEPVKEKKKAKSVKSKKKKRSVEINNSVKARKAKKVLRLKRAGKLVKKHRVKRKARKAPAR